VINLQRADKSSLPRPEALPCTVHSQLIPRQEVQTIKIEYFPDSDSLYVELADRPGADTREIEEGIILDIDEDGHADGIDIDQASKHLDLKTLNIRRLPFAIEQLAS